LINLHYLNHIKKQSIIKINIGRSLGQGTFGKVRLGTHLITGEKVAIKILEKDKIKD
jgi:5'-AMP-activated protein kinase, catalytic alpha subunit